MSEHNIKDLFEIFRNPTGSLKPMDAWTTEDLVPFRCPQEFQTCIDAVDNGEAYTKHFYFFIELCLEGSKNYDDVINFSLMPPPDRVERRPLPVSLLSVKLSDYNERDSVESKYHFIMKLNREILTQAIFVSRNDTRALYNSEGRIVMNRKIASLELQRMQKDLNTVPTKKNWWSF